jgi:hypothetical protein
MADQQTRRMHTVPQGYLEAFAVQDPGRRKPAIWRFDRASGEANLVGVRDAEVQLLRTPRARQLMRDELDAERIVYAPDTPQRVMLGLISRWMLRIARMRGIIAHNETDFTLLTCDNPAVTWKKRGAGFRAAGTNVTRTLSYPAL